MSSKRIAVVGAGPAGLVAALTGKRLNLDVAVYEQAPDFRRVGGGIMIHSNGQRVLDALGLLESFEPQMFLATRGLVALGDGKILGETDFREIEVPFNRGAVILRYTLQEHLLEAARRAGVPVHFNRRCDAIELHDDKRATLKFSDNTAETFDVVIACDGIHSRVRDAAGFDFKKIAVNEGWLRGVVSVPPKDAVFREIWGDDGRRFGVSPLVGEKTYFYCRVPVGEWEEIRAKRLNEWIASWKTFGEDAVNYSELFEIRAAKWHKPPVFLTGDAAHAMTPNIGQGANSSMVDAFILMQMLADAFQKDEPLESVGQKYDALRRPFVTKLQTTARQAGRLAASTSPFAHIFRNLMFAATSRLPALRRTSLRHLTGYNPREEEFFTRKL